MGAILLLVSLGGILAVAAGTAAARAAYRSTLLPGHVQNRPRTHPDLPRARVRSEADSLEHLPWIAGAFAGLTVFATSSFIVGLVYAAVFESG